MSIPEKDKSLLTDKEKERLTDPNLDSNIKKRNNLIVKRKIQSWLNDAGDVLFALENMNETKVKDSIEDENVYAMFKIIKTLLDKMDFEPVQGYPQHPFTIIRYTRDGARYIRKIRAGESDLERNWQVQEFVRYLKQCYHSDPKEESLAYKKYRVNRENKELRIQIKQYGLKQPDYLPGEEEDNANREEPPK
jgi:hypothetical protein